jgi:DNA-binding MurR/RpiR family transcriptional regulator
MCRIKLHDPTSLFTRCGKLVNSTAMRFLEHEMGSLSGNQRRIADYLLQNRSRLPVLTVDQLAEEIGVSIASISRFARAAGYSSLRELRTALHSESFATPSKKLHDRLSRIDADHPLADVFAFEADNLSESRGRVSEAAFNRAVEAIDQAPRLFVWAAGPSIALIDLLRFRLNRFGTVVVPVDVSGPWMAEALVNLTSEDVALVFCFFQDRPEAARVLTFASDHNATSILCTDLMVADIVECAEIVLQIYRGAMGEFHSLVAPVALVDALVLGVARRRPELHMNQLNRLSGIRDELSP